MGDLYDINPSVCIYTECYHYQHSGGDRNISHKVFTYHVGIKLKYNSCRDISGNFDLNINENNSKCKYYVLLKVIHEVIFEDDSLLNEFNALKSDLIERVRNLDRFYAYLEYIETNGINNINLIKLGEKEPLFITFYWYIIFTVLSLATLYKIYMCLICFDRTVIIKKLISSRNNLLDDVSYNKYNPTFKYQNKTFAYGYNDHIIIPIDEQRDLPISEKGFQTNSNINNENNFNNKQISENRIIIPTKAQNNIT